MHAAAHQRYPADRADGETRPTNRRVDRHALPQRGADDRRSASRRRWAPAASGCGRDRRRRQRLDRPLGRDLPALRRASRRPAAPRLRQRLADGHRGRPGRVHRHGRLRRHLRLARDLDRFIEPLRDGYDLAMGNRFTGADPAGRDDVEPPLHRQPGASGMLKVMFWTSVGDSHSGIRAFTREAYERLGLRAPGMEFASEMVIKAAKFQTEDRRRARSPTTRARATPSCARFATAGATCATCCCGARPTCSRCPAWLCWWSAWPRSCRSCGDR